MLAATAAAEFEANLLLDLQLVMDKQVQPGSYYERVIEILDRSPRSTLAHRSANAFAAQSGIA
jgi:hypothetical protein